jgi:hypothetical protein
MTSKAGLRIVLGYWMLVGAVAASAGTREAGLWELTTTTTWQKAPAVPGGATDFMKNSTHTTQVCLTQEMIDKYGALLPQSRGQCSLSNKVLNPGSVTADYVCTGTMNGKGDVVSKWSDVEHSKSSVHFVGTLRVGPDELPIEWTTESIAVFKSANCGSVKPASVTQPQH